MKEWIKTGRHTRGEGWRRRGRRADAEPETSSIGDEMVCSQRRDEMKMCTAASVESGLHTVYKNNVPVNNVPFHLQPNVNAS